MSEWAYVYILASGFKRLDTGVTNDLERRVWEHKNPADLNSFTTGYRISQLVYFEQFGRMTSAIAREKELKGWLRTKKIALIVASNPTWQDLSLEWGRSMRPFREPESKR